MNINKFNLNKKYIDNDILNKILEIKNNEIIIFYLNDSVGLNINSKINENIVDLYILVLNKLKSYNGFIICVCDNKILGGSMLFPMISDLVIGTKKSIYGFPEINYHKLPNLVMMANDKNNINKKILNRLILSGENFNADMALNYCFISEICDDYDLLINKYLKNIENIDIINFKNIFENNYVNAKENFINNFDIVLSTEIKNELVKFIDHNNYCIITFNNINNNNLINIKLSKELLNIVRYIKIKSNKYKVIIINGNGKNFCTGGDFDDINNNNKLVNFYELIYPILLLKNLYIPIICICHGKVIGGGLSILQNSDIKIAAKDTELNLGWITRGLTSGISLGNILKKKQIGVFSYLTNKFYNIEESKQHNLIDIVCDNVEQCMLKAIEITNFIINNDNNLIYHNLKNLRPETNYNNIFTEIFNHEESEYKNKIKNNFNILEINNGSNIKDKKSDIGILFMEIYVPKYYCSQKNIEIYDNQINKYTNGLKQINVGFIGDNEDSVSMSLSVVNNIMKKNNIQWNKIGRIEVGTESSIDKSKSIKSFIMKLFNENNEYDIEGSDTINGCYGGTSALFNTINWLESETGKNDNRYGLIVCTDISYVSNENKFFGGAGAIAIILGKSNVNNFNQIRTSCMKNTYDFYRPINNINLFPIIDNKYSIECYLNSLKICLNNYKLKTKIKKLSEYYDYILFHSPNSNMAYKAFKLLIMNDYQNDSINESFIREIFDKKVAPSLYLTKHIGSTYNVSLYFNLYSLIYFCDLTNKKILLYSYGSGSASSLFSINFTYNIGVNDPELFINFRINKSVNEYIKINDINNNMYNHLNYEPFANDNIQYDNYYLINIDNNKKRTYKQIINTNNDINNSNKVTINYNNDTNNIDDINTNNDTNNIDDININNDTNNIDDINTNNDTNNIDDINTNNDTNNSNKVTINTNNIKKILYDILNDMFGNINFEWNKSLLESGFDSLTAIEFRDKLGNLLNIEFENTLIYDYSTLDEINNHILDMIDNNNNDNNLLFENKIEILNEGIIEWYENLNINSNELKKYVNINNGEIIIDSSKYKQLNSKCKITLFIKLDFTELENIKKILIIQNKHFLIYKDNRLEFISDKFN